MAQVTCAVATFRTDLVGGAATYYWTDAQEYTGAGAPGPFHPRIKEFVNFERTAFGDNTTFGEIERRGGELRVADADGTLDVLLDYGPVEVALYVLAAKDAAWASRKTLLIVGIEQVFANDNEGVKTLRLKDGRSETRGLYQTVMFAGTNVGAAGVEGTADDLKDQPKPVPLGYVFQAPVPMANPNADTVFLGWSRIENIGDKKIYDGLVGIDRGTGYASLALLQGSSPAPGEFNYYLGDNNDGAYAILGTTPKVAITADIEGYAPGGQFLSLPGELLYDTLINRAGIAGGRVSSADCNAIDTELPHPLGIWVDGNMTCADVCDLIAQSVLGFWGKDRFGVYRFMLLRDPGAEVPGAYFKMITPLGAAKNTDGDIIDLQLVASDDRGGLLPSSNIGVLYKECVQTASQIVDTAADPMVFAFARKRFRRAVPSAPLTDFTPKYPMSPPMEFETRQATEPGAIAIADRAAALFNVEGRKRFVATLALTDQVIEQVDFGSFINITWPRYGLQAGKNAQVLGVRTEIVGGINGSSVIVAQLLV